MELIQLELTNFRAFKKITMKFVDNLTVIIGNNGAGKTSILDAIAIGMTHITGNLLSATEHYNIDAWFKSDDLSNDSNNGEIKIKLKHHLINNGEVVEVSVFKERSEKGLTFDTSPKNFIQDVKSKIKENKFNSLPIIVYFNANRTYEQFKSNKKAVKTYNNKLFAYERALELKSPSFGVFEKWFTNQLIEENAYKVKMKDFSAELPSLKFIKDCLNEYFLIIEPDTYGELATISNVSKMPDFSEKVETSLVIEKNGSAMLIKQLSNGERMVIGLVVEIARRLFIANESDYKNGTGIVLIDELELHLHPAWQKRIVTALKTVFPKLNFIFTSHAPLVLSGVRRKNIKILKAFDEIPNEDLPNIYSATSDELLEKLMGTSSEMIEYEIERKEIDYLFNELKFDEAHSKLIELKEKLKSEPNWLNDYEQKIAFARS